MSLVLAAAFLLAMPASVMELSIQPSATDPAINTFDSPHTVYFDSVAKPRNQLLVFFPGTNGKTRGIGGFCSTAAELGYQVINLMYPDDIPATVVRNQKDRDAFLNFRLEIIEGNDLSTFIDVNRANSIENRLIKALQYLDKTRPKEGWGKYLTAKGELDWPDIAVSGLSQGAGHAALIATRHRVARAIMFGGPKDYDRSASKPAGWYTPPATPIERFFTFNHEQDQQGCDLKEQLEICGVMGLEKFGKAVSVDSVASPFKNSRILTTNYPGTPLTSVRAHTSVVANGSTPKGADGGWLFKPVWIYMLTAGK